ncbi:MAG: hypothetical protein Q8O67_32165 [Deltaproteobacteria bacterium]|nr:hypothetical protein [Deltaproteobacteria bacterium]
MRAEIPLAVLFALLLPAFAGCSDGAARAECEKAVEAHKASVRKFVDVRSEFADPSFDSILAAQAKAAGSDEAACKAVARFADEVTKGRALGESRRAREDADAARDKVRTRTICRSDCQEKFPDEHTCAIKCGCVPVAGKGAAAADCFEPGSKACAQGCKTNFAKLPPCLAACD